MKNLTAVVLAATLSYSSLSNASVVISEEKDNIVGKGIGGWAGVLIGGAAGGPVGALIGGLAGLWSGGEAQQATGQSGTAYRVKKDDGSEVVVRSPNRQWQAGDQVTIVGNRLTNASEQLAAAN